MTSLWARAWGATGIVVRLLNRRLPALPALPALDGRAAWGRMVTMLAPDMTLSRPASTAMGVQIHPRPKPETHITCNECYPAKDRPGRVFSQHGNGGSAMSHTIGTASEGSEKLLHRLRHERQQTTTVNG